MNKSSRLFDVNILSTKCSSLIRLVKYYILLWLVVNAICTFGHGELDRNYHSAGKNKKYASKLCDGESMTISIAHLDHHLFSKDQDEIEPSFKYSQMLKMILFDIEHDEEDVVEILRKHYASNQTMLKLVNEFEQDYDQHSPIWWYTRDCFLSSIINQALQTMNMKMLIKMALIMHDICQQIENFHTQKSNSPDSLIVYRCIKLNPNDFKKLQQNENFWMSFNSFLLASIDQELASEICSTPEQNNELLPVLFEIKIEENASKFTPFIWLDHLSNKSNLKKDILFSMNSVFRIISMEKNPKNTWQVQLIGINNNDSSLEFFNTLMNLKTSKKKGWNKLGHLMISMRELKHAEELYKVLLESIGTSNKEELILLYDNLGNIKSENGSYEEAYSFYEKKLQLQLKLLASNHFDIASTYTAIGVLNSRMGKLENALSSHRKALEIQESILPSNHPHLAITYDNIGMVIDKMGDHLTALSFHQKALQISETVLPSNHPDLAITYNNIAGLYKFLGNYVKALLFFEKAVHIQERILSSNDPELATTYDNIGGVYQAMEQFENAFLFYEKALKINEKVLHSNHPELAYTYSNIGNTKLEIGDYLNAILYYQKALQIRQNSLPANHPSLADSYTDIGNVYRSMRQFSNSLSFYEKALQVQEISLPHDHSDFVFTYIKLGQLYYMNGKYATALSYFERGLEIGEVSLPENHPWMKTLEQSIALLEKDL